MNKNLLRAKIVEKGFTIDKFCTACGFVRSTFDRRMAGISPFNIEEVEAMSIILELTDDELTAIFFPNYVAEISNK